LDEMTNKLFDLTKKLSDAVTFRQKVDARADLQYYLWQSEGRAMVELDAIPNLHLVKLILGAGPRGALYEAVVARMHDLRRGPVRPSEVM